MAFKFIMIVMLIGACLAYPADEETRPPNTIAKPVGPVISEPPIPQEDPEYVAPVQEQAPDQQEPENPDSSDLKTANSFWWRKSYYPIYGRSFYRPRVYSYYTPRFYSYYTPYKYWGSYW